MGIITVEKTDRLFWLGRYTERVYTTAKLYAKSYDYMIDTIADDYKNFCKAIDIPDVYGSKEAFLEKYPFDENDTNSLAGNLQRAYDNAIELRYEIGSEALAYIQLCIYDLQQAKKSDAPMLEIQSLIDHIMAFWGTADDLIASEQIRDILKTGKRVERIDLYARLSFPTADIRREVNRMKFRIAKSRMNYKESVVKTIETLVQNEPIDYYGIVREIENIL